MSKIAKDLAGANLHELERAKVADKIANILRDYSYELEEIDSVRPWGQFFRIKDAQADKFIKDFFSELDMKESDLPRTPKILLHYPMQRNSWQYHNLRKEFWRFLTDGFYYRSMSDDAPGTPLEALADELVVFDPQERHRLSGHFGSPTLVAEIWEHIAETPSSEDDIVRLSDDYKLNGRKVGK